MKSEIRKTSDHAEASNVDHVLVRSPLEIVASLDEATHSFNNNFPLVLRPSRSLCASTTSASG
jgi:hypothetical protein